MGLLLLFIYRTVVTKLKGDATNTFQTILYSILWTTLLITIAVYLEMTPCSLVEIIFRRDCAYVSLKFMFIMS